MGYHGYVRATNDMDVWIAPDAENAARTIAVLREFGFNLPESAEQLLIDPDNVLRMGVPPVRLELLSSISGVSFEECYAERVVDTLDDVEVSFINLDHLKLNKKASCRAAW